MRIAMFSTDFPALPPFFQTRPARTWWGGVGKVTYKLALGMAERGHEVEVFATHHLAKRQDVRYKAISLHLYPADFKLSETYVSLRFMRGLPRTKPDVVHAHDGSPPGLIAGWACSRRMNAPLVVTLHAELYLENRGPGAAVILRSFARLEQRILSDSRSIIALTENVKLMSKTLRQCRPKVSVIPNGVDPGAHQPPDAKIQARAALGFPPATKVCLYVGTLNQRKGIDVLLDAALLVSTADPMIFVVVGKSPENVSSMESKIETARVDGRVRFEGFVDDAEIPTYFQAADLLVIPSRLEGFPLTLLDGFATPLPVVASDIGPHREIIQDGRNGILFKSGDARDLAAKIEMTLRSSELMSQLSENSLECSKQFTWERVLNETENVYRLAIG